MNENNIIIKQSYFTNIKIAIDSINEFFASQFKTKNFPVLEEGIEVDPTVERILSHLNAVDPTWPYDENKYQDMLNLINGELDKIDPTDGVYQTLLDTNNETLIQAVESYIGFKVLTMIADNFEAFTKFINGIYTFEIFYKPSEYADVLNIFDQYIQFDEVPTLDLEEKIFDDAFYVDGIFKNADISIPEELTVESEVERITTRTDLTGYEILVDDSVQEAAEINYFENDKPQNMKYSDSQKKFLISNEFITAVDELVAGLRKCDTTDDLLNYFKDDTVIPKLVSRMSRTVIPYILVKVLTNPKKTASDFSPTLKKYTDSYASILSQNNGARRFENYDLFSTFKSDKEGTIKFIEDFCKLNLVNDSDASIANNTLLTMFNIFDSRIYLDLAYNVAPESIKSTQGEDAFVKTIRARINKNSREAMKYNEKENMKKDNGLNKSETVKEYTSLMEREFGSMSLLDIQYCEGYQSLLYDEISTMNDTLFNEGYSQIDIDKWIGEAVDPDSADEGELPGYIRKRIKMSDDLGATRTPTTVDVNLPPDVPSNSIDQLADSVDDRMDTDTNKGLEGMLGRGYEGNIGKDGKHVVYNITYNNSFNKDSYNTRSNTTTNTTTNTTNDNSSNKHEEIDNSQQLTNSNNLSNSQNDTSQNKDMSNDKHVVTTNDSHNNISTNTTDSHNTTTNNYNNSNTSSDTVAEQCVVLSNGMSIRDMFNILEAVEPLSEAADATPPHEDTLTKAMDRDRKLLSSQQTLKQKVQKGVNTTRAVLKPVSRAKQWMTKIVDSLIKRDEDKVKAEIVESRSYRTALYKASRLALKLGLVGISATISGYLAAAVATVEVLRGIDKDRLKREVQSEIATEIRIMDDKIDELDRLAEQDPSKLKEKYQMMRQRNKMMQMAASARQTRLVHPNSIA